MTEPYWLAQVSLPSFPKLQRDEKAELVIVGAGIAGLTCAYLLLKAGKSVIICDKNVPGSGETMRTTGHLANFLDDRFTELERVFGTQGLKKALDSHGEAVDLIEKIIRDENISCDFERLDGFLFRCEGDFSSILLDELHAAGRASYQLELCGHPYEKEALKMKNQAQFHPLKYIVGLMGAIEKLGGKIYGQTLVTEIREGKIKTEEGHTLSATYIIIATNSPVHNRFVMHTKQAAYRTYVLVAPIEKNSYPKGLYYDTGDPYHYIRLDEREGEQFVIVGGEDHKTGQEKHTADCFDHLENWARRHIPGMKKVISKWSGQIMEPVDSLGFMGHDPLEKNLFLITGDSGNGLTHTTIGAKIIVEEILGKISPYAELYDPKRKSLKTIGSFVEENINVAVCYAQWLIPEGEEESLPDDSGIVIQEKGKKIALYKDSEGNCHKFSAVCPHLGCIVRWNEVEKSWDCPCHGSRFTCKGKSLNGPATGPLKELF